MSRRARDLLLLFLISLVVRLVAVWPILHPDYMDAVYSYDIAVNLAQGQGLNEPFLWNYMDDPAGIPHPSHLYWMPLPTFLAWMGILLFGQSYRAAQVFFVLLSALLPLVSYWVAVYATRRRFYGWLAGLLTVFCGYYAIYWGHTDNFAPFALAGSLCLIFAWRAARAKEAGQRWLILALAAGVLAALAHLARADGLLLLVAIAIFDVRWLPSRTGDSNRRPRFDVGHLAWVLLGYILVMLPWLVRNRLAGGTLLTAGGGQTMWMTTYDDLFAYGRDFSLAGYLAWGWSNILRSKLDALWLNLQSMVAVWGMVFLAPLAVIGFWQRRWDRLFRLVVVYALLLVVVMTFVFTFAGPRGGLFHSGGALLPFIYAVALVGLNTSIEWAVTHRRSWDARKARRVFGAGLVGLALLVTGFVYYPAVFLDARWRTESVTYRRLADWLAARDLQGEIVMLGDPPGYWYIARGPAIVIPNEEPDTLLVVADRYGARYLILDTNRPTPLSGLYEGSASHAGLVPVFSYQDESGRPVHVFEIAQ